MRRVPAGTKIVVPTATGSDLGVVVYHEPSQHSKDVYMVKWADGSQTLFELRRENLVKDVRSTKKKTT
jgi:hypothetical protein